VGFEQDLRAYLEGLEREPPRPPTPRIDEHELYRHLVERLRALESAGATTVVERLFTEWTNKLPRFARYLETLSGDLDEAEPEEVMEFARRALDAALDCIDPEASLVERLEAERAFIGFVSGLGLIESYALENHLVRREPLDPLKVTELARVYLRLRGKDAVRWLVTAELAQNIGPRDPWHAPRALLEDATTEISAVEFRDGEPRFRYSEQTLARLESLGVLQTATGSDSTTRYRATTAMREALQAALEPGPWHTAVRALLDDERAVVVPATAATASEATIEQTKLIVHEVRNALIPVRHDLEALRPLAAEHAQVARIDSAKQGVARVLDFVEEMVQMSELITEPAVRCDLRSVADEALSWVDTARRVQRLSSPSALYVFAPRARLARAISNVVGNALQATAAAQPVRLSVAAAGNRVQVIVDDGGPGVAVEHRARIFLEGVTMRHDGAGSGFGLAFAKRVVEEALQGKIWCEDSDLGGARFVIEVPQASPE
jgi:signal transduction histidine kinase